MSRFVAIGEVMIELSGGQGDLWRAGVAGDTLNTLWYARLGLDPDVDRVDYVTALGTDSQSDRILRTLTEAGIGTGGIRRIADRLPGLYMIEQRDGDRAFLYWRQNSAARGLADDAAALDHALASADLIYLSGITLAILAPEGRARLLAALDAARSRGAKIACDPNIRPALWPGAGEMRQCLTDIAGRADILLPSFDDEARAFGDASPAETVARYRAAGAGEIVVKNAGGPVALSDGNTVPVEAGAAVTDATGAGDSFNGGYLAARLKGRSPAEAARAGNAVARQVIAASGAIVDLPGAARWRSDTPEAGARAAARFAARRVPAWLAEALPGGDSPAPVVEAQGEAASPRTSLTQCRAVFTLAHLARTTGDAGFLAAAHRVHRFAVAHLRDADGGYRMAVAADGAPLSTAESRLRRSYDQSFALLALAALMRAGSAQVSRVDLDDVWRFVSARLTEPGTAALWQNDRGADGAAIRSQNPHMHMLEAVLEAFEATRDSVWCDRAGQLIDIAERYFIDPETGAMREVTDRDLTPLAGPQGARREPGHQFEWAWLLRRYARLSGDRAPITAAERLQAFAERHGVRRAGPLAGAPFDAVDADGGLVEDTHLLWPMTEAGKLYADLARDGADPEAAARARRIAGIIFGRYFAPLDAPRWANQLDGDGRVVWETALSRLLYHVAIFVTEGGRAGLWRLDGQDGRPDRASDNVPFSTTEEETRCIP